MHALSSISSTIKRKRKLGQQWLAYGKIPVLQIKIMFILTYPAPMDSEENDLLHMLSQHGGEGES
jgi:hypothetical protein